MINLATRSITGLVVFIGALLLILYSPSWVFVGVVQLVVLQLLLEYKHITKLHKLTLFGVFVLQLCITLFVWYWDISLIHSFSSFFVVVALWWLVNTVVSLTYPRSNTLVNYHLFKPFNALLLVLPFGLGVIHLQNIEPLWLLLLVCTVVAVDVCSYTVGKLVGKHVPLSLLSPHKTLEGFVGGIIGAGVLSYGYIVFILEQDALSYMVVIVLTALAAIVGDLYQSMHKRIGGVKDSGALLPGHGGVWDRVDGLLAATPVFLLSLYYIR